MLNSYWIPACAEMTRDAMLVLLLLAHILIASASAHARDADGRLTGILAPHEAAPAAVAPGDTFTVTLDFEADASSISASLASGNTRIPCDVLESAYIPERRHSSVRVQVPSDAAPGLYALQLAANNTQYEIPRAVFVVARDHSHNILAVLRSPRISDDASIENFVRVVNAINDSEAQAVVILGDLTGSGAPDEFRALLQLLNQCSKPTWLSPGPRDHLQGAFNMFYGAATQLVRVGPDALLLFDSGAPHALVPGSAQAGLLHQYRRASRDARWTLALTHAMSFQRHPRYPLTLFVDDPVDALVVSELPKPPEKDSEEAPPLAAIPWSKAKLFAVPDARQGEFLLMDLLDGGLFPRGVQTVNATETQGETLVPEG